MSADLDPLLVLEDFILDEVIDEVVGLVKPGKEAIVYLVRKCGDPPRLFAAKIYKQVIHRSFRTDSAYSEGRFIQDARTRRAVAGGTGHGKRAHFNMWIEQECEALQRLHAAGADVPRFYGASDHVVLMEYIGDEQGPAPMLRQVHLLREQAQQAFDRIIANIEIFLEVGIVHGDLSPYNILYWNGSIKIIDFPQAVDLYENPQALELLARDMKNVCDFFSRSGVRCSPSDVPRRLKHLLPGAVVMP